MTLISKYKICYLLTIFSYLMCFSQEKQKQLEIADKKYQNYFYIDAIQIYLELANENLLDENGLKKLANCYYFNADYINANKWYEVIFNKKPLQTSEYCYRYGQTLKSVGNYSEANRMMDIFSNLASQELRAKLIKANKDYLQKIKDNSNRYDIANLSINSSFSDFGASLWGNKLVFSSTKSIEKKLDKNAPTYSKLYVAEVDSDGDFKQPVLLFKKNKTKYNESSAVFTKDGKTMYFTRNTTNKSGKELNLKIYKASLVKNSWKNIIELPFNSNTYNASHPALSPDEKTLYFSSDMPGSYGQTDLFYVSILPNGSFSKPINMGDAINTEGKESFPFISEENELYFSSDGHPGLGGFDVFLVKKGESKVYNEAINLGHPINTSQDDFAYTINSTTRIGYVTSNRLKEGQGKDDLYWFFEKHKIDSYSITNKVLDKFTGLPLEGVKITLLDEQFKTVHTAITDKNGIYELPKIPYNKKMYIRIEKDAFLTDEIVIDTKETRNQDELKDAGINNQTIALEKRIAPLKTGDDLAKLLEIGNLYFEFQKYDITPIAAIQLGKIAKLMQLYPEVKIEIKTYTDSRGSTQFNQKLSNDRYTAVIKWLLKKGISAHRLSGQGFGETKILNRCKDGVDCTIEEHEINRRCEFIFTK